MSAGPPGRIGSKEPPLAVIGANDDELIPDLRGGMTSIDMIDGKLYALLEWGESIDTAQPHLRVSARTFRAKPR